MLRKLHKFLSGFSEFKVYMFFVDSPIVFVEQLTWATFQLLWVEIWHTS